MGALALVLASLAACTTAQKPVTVVARPSVEAMKARGTFLPPPLDGARLLAKNVELALPRGCVPLPTDSFVRVATMVNDAESDLLAACNMVGDDGVTAKATIILIRHHLEVETGESAAVSLRRAPGVIDVQTTTAGATAGQQLGPEVVLSTNLPTGPKARPSASVFFGAHDGLYVLYAEVDGDLESLAAWGEAMTSTIRPIPSARPIRWRAPTKLAPSSTALGGPHKMHLPETIKVVPKTTKTLGVLVGDAADPLDVRESESLFSLRDEAGIAMGGSVYKAKLLPPIAPTPSAMLAIAASARGGKGIEHKLVDAKLGAVARIDATRADGSHDVYAGFESSPGEVTVVRMVFTKEKWPVYAPFIDATIASFSQGTTDDATPY